MERSISDYRPGSGVVVNKGGRGVKAAGRGHLVIPDTFAGRRPAKYPDAEKATVKWMRRGRKKGTKITPRITKAAMRRFVRQKYPTAVGFKASSGWIG